MSVTVEELRAVLRMELKPFQRDLQQANGISAKAARQIEATFRASNRRLDSIGKSMAQSLIAPLAGISAAASVNQVVRYADAWTVAGNKIKAAEQVSGMQGRSLEEINTLANETRSGISETTDLYAKLMRSTKGVAQSEIEVARATEIVNKAFKAGGAAASEQTAGIMQLAQGLGSGVLQGDELRSIRENAPLLAQAIADYFGVTIAGLKELGSEGKLTSDKVFKAILSAQPQIEAAFASTNQTIGDGVTRVNNALTQYIGQSDASLGATDRLVAGLNGLADNFDQTADTVLQLAGVIAGALVGRSLVGMIAKLGIATKGAYDLVKALRSASSLSSVASAFGGLGAAAAPIGLLIGGLATGAFVLLEKNAAQVAGNIDIVTDEIDRLGISAKGADGEIKKATASINDLADVKAEQKLRAIRAELDRIQNGSGFTGVPKGRAASPQDVISTANRINSVDDFFQSSTDKNAKAKIAELAQGFIDLKLSAEQVVEASKKISLQGATDGVVALNGALRESVRYAEDVRKVAATEGISQPIIDLSSALETAEGRLRSIASAEGVSQNQIDTVVELTSKYRESGDGAEAARRALQEFAAVNPKMGAIVDALNGLIAKLAEARSQANSTAEAIGRAIGGNLGVGGEGRDERAGKDPYLQQRDAGNKLIADQVRLNALSKEQTAMEREKAEIRKRAASENAILTDKQLDDLARQNIAADSRRSGEGKKAPAVKKTAEDRFGEDIQETIDRTTALRDEIAMVGLSYQEQEKRRMALDLEQSALRDLREEARRKGQTDLENIKLSAEHRQKIDQASDAYARQAEELRRVQDANQRSEEAASEFYDTFKSGVLGSITGANNLNQALGNLAKKFSDLLLNSAFDGLFKPGSGGQSGGIFGSIFSGIGKIFGYDAGGYTGPGGKKQPAGVVHKGEVVFSQTDVARHGGVQSVEALRKGLSGYANGGTPGIPAIGPIGYPRMPNLQSLVPQPTVSTPVFNIDARGAESGVEEKIKGALEQAFKLYDKGNTARVAVGYANAARRRML